MKLLAAALLALPAPVLACVGPQSEVATFLTRLTEAQADAPFAARVRVTGVDASGGGGETFPLYEVEVIETLRGAAPETLRVATAGHSCARRVDVEIGSEWIVAGAPMEGVLATSWNLWETELAPPASETAD